jgi:hypothetical protein
MVFSVLPGNGKHRAGNDKVVQRFDRHAGALSVKRLGQAALSPLGTGVKAATFRPAARKTSFTIPDRAVS